MKRITKSYNVSLMNGEYPPQAFPGDFVPGQAIHYIYEDDDAEGTFIEMIIPYHSVRSVVPIIGVNTISAPEDAFCTEG